MDASLSTTENNNANKISGINKLLFITFSTNRTTYLIFKYNQSFRGVGTAHFNMATWGVAGCKTAGSATVNNVRIAVLLSKTKPI